MLYKYSWRFREFHWERNFYICDSGIKLHRLELIMVIKRDLKISEGSFSRFYADINFSRFIRNLQYLTILDSTSSYSVLNYIGVDTCRFGFGVFEICFFLFWNIVMLSLHFKSIRELYFIYDMKRDVNFHKNKKSYGKKIEEVIFW